MTRELSDETLSLIRTALAEERGPGSSHRERLRRRVLTRAAAGGVATLVGSGVAKGSASLLSVVAGSVGVGFGAGLVLAGAAQLAFAPSAQSGPNAHPDPATLTHSVNATSAVARAKDDPAERAPWGPVNDLEAGRAVQPEVQGDSGEATERAAVRHGHSAEGASTGAKGSPLRAELDLMAQAQGALRDGQAARALDLIASYDAQYPSGVLETERLAVEVFAACQTGDRTRARHAAQRFLARDSVSALAARVKNACSTRADRAP